MSSERGSAALRLRKMVSGVGRDVLPLRFAPEDERRFRKALRRNLVYARTGIFLGLAIAFGMAPFAHEALFRPTAAVDGLLSWIEVGCVLPVALLAALLTAVPGPPRPLVQAAQTTAVLAALFAVIGFRVLALQGQMVYPAQMVGIVLIAVAVFGLFRWTRVAFVAGLAVGTAIASEYAFANADSYPALQAYSLAIMGAVAMLAAYNLETLARFAWWESSQLRRVRAELLQSERNIRLQSMTDELTGHYNRRGFQLLAEQELRHARRRQQRCALFFLDLDDLKGINERHGHDGGDQALVTAAEALRVAARNTDIVARIGGDEFLVLAVDCTDPEALRNRILDLIDGYNAAGALPFPLSVSLGATELASDEVSLDALIAEADARMYSAKRARSRSPA